MAQIRVRSSKVQQEAPLKVVKRSVLSTYVVLHESAILSQASPCFSYGVSPFPPFLGTTILLLLLSHASLGVLVLLH